MRRRRAVVVVAAIVAAGFAIYPRWTDMTNNRTHLREIRRLAGPAGDALAPEGTAVAADAPDANYKPQAYYLLRPLDEAGFRTMAGAAGLAVAPTPARVDAVWKLPPGVQLGGWRADTVPPGAGLQAQGTVGQAAVWLRWHGGQAFVVVMPSAP